MILKSFLENHQEFQSCLAIARRMILVQDRGVRRITSAKHPHVRFAGVGTPRFIEHLQWRFVQVDQRPAADLILQQFNQR